MTPKSNLQQKIALIACKGLLFSAVLLFGGFFCPQAHAQFIGYTSPQTVQNANLLSNTSCTGDVFATVQNVGQTVHSVTYFVSTLSNTLRAQLLTTIEGSFDGVNYFPISNTGSFDPVEQQNLLTGITGQGYFPAVRVHFQCLGAGFMINSASYSGTSVSRSQPLGLQNVGEYSVNYVVNASAGSNNGPLSGVTTPYGNAAGIVSITPSAALPAGSQMVVTCDSSVFAAFTLAATNATQTFPVPAQPCTTLNMSYVSGGASATLYQINYSFQQPGFTATLATLYNHITATTATVVKGTPGALTKIAINTPAAGTISVFDLAAAGCTGTPSTNVVAVITSGASDVARTIPFDAYLHNGICVKTSVAMDLTVVYQ